MPDHRHLSQLVLFRLLAGETSGLEDARAHLEACPQCQEALEALRKRQAEWRSGPETEAFLQDLKARSSPSNSPSPVVRLITRRWALPAAGLAAASVAAIALSRSPAPDVGTKGQASASVVVIESEASSRRLADDEVLAPGAKVGFRARCPEACEVSLFAVAGPEPIPLIEGFEVSQAAPVLLPFVATLDAAPGDERLRLVFCPPGTGPAEARRAAQGAHRLCSSQSLRIRKRE